MTRPLLAIRRLGRDDRGATIIEFAMILPALCVLLVGIFELGYRSYAASLVQGALHDAARMATVGGVTMDEIDAQVRARLNPFTQHGTLEIATSNYFEFSGVGRPEPITTDTAPLNEFNVGDCFRDSNNSGAWEVDRGIEGMGNSEDIVRYSITLNYQSLFPIEEIMGWEPGNTIAASTVLRNQPYAGRVVTPAPIICTGDPDPPEEEA